MGPSLTNYTFGAKLIDVTLAEEDTKSILTPRNFYIYLTALGEVRGGSTQAVSLTAFSQFFFSPSQSPIPNEAL